MAASKFPSQDCYTKSGGKFYFEMTLTVNSETTRNSVKRIDGDSTRSRCENTHLASIQGLISNKKKPNSTLSNLDLKIYCNCLTECCLNLDVTGENYVKIGIIENTSSVMVHTPPWVWQSFNKTYDSERYLVNKSSYKLVSSMKVHDTRRNLAER
ncbi:hypothetical protein J6590_018782 [Homalodisca vitripennis]|nr:hypothetical protein J6590_018782 [Homalodisca vitripennis]